MPSAEENSGLTKRKDASSSKKEAAPETNQQNAAGNAQQHQAQPAERSLWQTVMSSLPQLLFMYMLFNYFNGGSKPTNPTTPSVKYDLPEGDLTGPTPVVAPFWYFGTMLDLYVYTSESENFTSFNDPAALAWKTSAIEFGQWDDERHTRLTIPATTNIQNNGSLYAHIYLTHHLVSPNPNDPTFNETKRTYIKHPLTVFRKKHVVAKKKKLIGGSQEDSEEDAVNEQKEDPPIVSHWFGNLTLNLVNQQDVITVAQIPDPLKKHIIFEQTGLRDSSGSMSYYYPIIFANEFWMLSDHLSLINNTVSELPLDINFYPLSMFKFQAYTMLDESLRQSMAMSGNANESDELKRMLIETNPWLLGVTAFVSVLHSIFDFLAFKNDITFWKDKKDVAGISVRAIVLNFVFQVIIFLYLLDNQENTSWMILCSAGVGLLIEAWKIKKAVNVAVTPVEGGWLPWKITFEDKESYTESKTKEYDQMAFTYLSYVAYPLLFGYAIYTLVYETHRSWYSWVLGTAVGFVYTFGFISMTPQLFINYKLKSVAHMPWRTFMYKALNTFIDDLFAFVIKMPTLHRLACLRDDIVFFVYLYQRWIYPVDETRANEFGQVGQDEDQEPVESKKEK